MTRIAVITGSTRPGRRGTLVSDWVMTTAATHPSAMSGRAEFELIDLAEVNLPFLDEAMPPIVGQYANPHTKSWAATIDSFDGFIFVTPEYNHSFPGVLKNAIDYVYAEWRNKAAGFVGYGPSGGIRAVEQLRLVLAELSVAGVRNQVVLDRNTDTELVYGGDWAPTAGATEALNLVLTDTIAWADALATVRVTDGAELAAA
ncbi:MAG: NADPH-dependent FMN reductase [Stackebrandtia sp.]